MSSEELNKCILSLNTYTSIDDVGERITGLIQKFFIRKIFEILNSQLLDSSVTNITVSTTSKVKNAATVKINSIGVLNNNCVSIGSAIKVNASSKVDQVRVTNSLIVRLNCSDKLTNSLKVLLVKLYIKRKIIVVITNNVVK